MYFGLTIIFISMFFTGIILDFFTILFTDKNLNNTSGIHGILTFIWFAPTLSFGIYIGLEFLIPGVKKELKNSILFTYIILAIIFDLFLFLDPFGTVDYKMPSKSGENLIDNVLIIGSPASILVMIFFATAILFFVVRFLYGSVKSTGLLREKFTRLTICFVLLIGFGTVDILFFLPTIILIIVRYGMVVSGLFFVLGVKKEEASTQPDEVIHDDEVESEVLTSSLSEVLSYSRPSDISTKDIELYRKQTICLVCKKKLKGFIDVFICPNCKSFYCDNCAQILTQLENMCWSCNNPIDDSKPIKPFKIEEDIDISISEGSRKTLREE
ncbi:MAG: hypothetical protein KAT66_06805 [Candidatus Lokiarchaeota archaeon]|nr:hypothetical protein [Candidatus Lokiarchaeota archaeon]